MKFLGIVIAVFLFSSCAVVVSGSKQIVLVCSNVDSARVTIDGETVGYTPFKFKTPRREAFPKVIVSKTGYKDGTLVPRQKFNELTYMNCINPLGWVIDLGTGAHNRYVIDTVFLQQK